MLHSTLESRTYEIGKAILDAVREDRAWVLGPRWWDERMMAAAMHDETVKLQLFRLVDTLPALHEPREITRHLREYFEAASDHLPGVVRRVLPMVPADGLPGKWIARAAQAQAQRMARKFIAGTDLTQTLGTLENLRAQRLAFTIDLLGEAVLSESEAERYQREYLTFVEGLADRAASWAADPLLDESPAGPLPRVNVSVKLSSLYSQFDPIDPRRTSDAVRGRLRPILRLARRRGAFVNVDMEQFAFKDLTLQIFREVLDEPEFRDWPDVGIAIQAYLKSCGDDLRNLADWARRRGTPVWVRLVKGAYWDYESVVAAQQNWPVPVWERKEQTDANFEAQTEFLVRNHDVLRPAIGSHNVRSIAHALALEESAGLGPGTIELQMLYGMADPLKAAMVDMGRRVRVYAPFGELLPGMAYLVRRLLENTSNQSFLRAGFLDHVPVERLLRDPMTQAAAERKDDSRAKAESNGRSAPAFRNEPLRDFSLAGNREAMEGALREVGERARKAEFCPLVIGGERVVTPGFIESVDPSHFKRVVGRCGRARVEDAGRCVAAAEAATPEWAQTPVGERAKLLGRAADVLRRRRFELAAWEVVECGKQWREADADVAEAIDYCEFYAAEMVRLDTPVDRNLPGEENRTFYEPIGVAVTIAPWNFPLAILCGMTAAAVVAGNPTIMKPAEQSSVLGYRLMEVFEEAGFPPGVVQYLPGVGEEIGPALVGHPDVAIVAFTGSRAVGLAINALAAQAVPGQRQVKRVIAEMGGKNATIIDADADLDEAVVSVAAAAFGYAGQKCSACSRAIVLDSVYDVFLERLVEATRSLRVGPAEDPSATVGPVIDDDAFGRITRTIASVTPPARLAYGGSAGDLTREGFYIPPHIFADVPPDSPLAREEIFGPVLSVIRARDFDDALRIANSTQYALTGGIHSRSPVNIERARREFRVGNLYINRRITGALVDRQPFGGFRLSGTGPKAGGPDYLPRFLNARTVTENTLRHGFAPTADPTEA